MSTKRNRSVNWEDEEKYLFRRILKDYSEILEDKTLTTNAIRRKAKAWEDVHKKFNSLNRRQRGLSQLKIQWKTMKNYARKKYKIYKKETSNMDLEVMPVDVINKVELDGIDHLGEIVFNPTESPKENDEIYPMTSNVNFQSAMQKAVDDPLTGNPLKTNMGEITATKDYHDDYVERMISHSKTLKEREFTRRMEMAEEKHTIEIEILKLERQICEEKLRRLINQ